jgi:hypothetical protein
MDPSDPSADFDDGVFAEVCPNDLINFPHTSHVVHDADEEIMELYMSLATTSKEDNGGGNQDLGGGLGFLDSNKSLLEFEFILTSAPADASGGPAGTGSRLNKGVGGRSGKRVARGKAEQEVRVVAQLQQDLNLLKAAGGDTGSVLWRSRWVLLQISALHHELIRLWSSLFLAKHILRQYHFPSPTTSSLLDKSTLSKARILELGAGTGLLSILLAPLCASYTVSDRFENLKLIQRNLALNAQSDKSGKGKRPDPSATLANVLVEEVDWMSISAERARAGDKASIREEYDLILAVDCIYNESLVQPLVDTLARYTSPNTVVWVVVELRSSDVVSRSSTAFILVDEMLIVG